MVVVEDSIPLCGYSGQQLLLFRHFSNNMYTFDNKYMYGLIFSSPDAKGSCELF